MNGGTGAKRAISVHALDQSAEIDGKFLLLSFIKKSEKTIALRLLEVTIDILILYHMEKKIHVRNSEK
jgi:hypothetical protein